ncbi:MAG: threonine synthase [Clostridia bacterium]|nr:threonine synthase [Clostridia bacterium]
MLYQSTRSNHTVNSLEAILQGIAPDGGLYLPVDLASLKVLPRDLADKSFEEMAAIILRTLFDEFTEAEMAEMVRRAYGGKFETEDVTPTVKVGQDYVLELFRGPTSAFKDVALSMLPVLITEAKKKLGITEKIMILTATSGDTGKAALEGFHDVDGTGIIVFYPNGGVSAVQKAQMVTQEGNNVTVCAIDGNFDDAQTGVKNTFAACADLDLKQHGVMLSSANSINIGRLAPQIVYYYKSYCDLVAAGEIAMGDAVNFVVPTGNFGDILAGYFAKCLGLPIGKLVCASNQNDVLTEFLNTGRYDRRRVFHRTNSPSMDILVSSNLERMLYLASGGDFEKIAGYMKALNEIGEYTVDDALLKELKDTFFAGCCSEAQTLATIGKTYETYGYLCDTHTAVAVDVADQFKNTTPAGAVIILSTASPYKFPVAVLTALGHTPDEDEFKVMEQLQDLTNVPIPDGLAGLKEKAVLHTDVIPKDGILDYVLKKVKA